jgi:hypothetical protein
MTSAPRDREPHSVLVQDFAFDLAQLEDILRERCQNGLGAQAEPQRFHAPDQAALPVADRREMLGVIKAPRWILFKSIQFVMPP